MICTKCKSIKDLSEFYVSRSTSRQKARISTECKSCFKDRMSKRHQDHKDILVDENGGKCSRCGYDKNSRILHFHHLNPALKSFEIADRLSANLLVLRKEIAKCILLCPNCHGEKHQGMW